MALVNSQQTYSPTGQTEADDRAKEIASWTIERATERALSEGIDLSINHITVLTFLRTFYVKHGWPKSTHELTRVLDNEFAELGGNKFLHELFPDGPIAQATRLAGVPTPDYAVDKSFGSTY
jgi:tRNA 2-thiouridine synthesizing protein E